ncbi:MAG: HAD family hydrolase, partial [Firmicutes bacterium]|nr:HAD family hydrolase [Bacillota bacterium]
WNGTLFDDVDLCFDCVNRLLYKYENKKLESLEAYKNVFGFPIQEYYKKAGFDFSKHPYEMLAHEYMDDYMNRSISCTLQKDAMQALEFVQNHGMKQVILSASKMENLLEQVNQFSLDSYIDDLYGIANIYAKSKQDLALKLKEDYPEDTFYFIGDSLHDIEVAQSIGSECVCVTCGHQSIQQLSQETSIIKNSLLESVEYIYARSQDSK